MRAFARFTFVLLLTVAIFTAYVTWQRTVAAEKRELSHLSGILAQGFQNQMAKQDVILQLLGESVSLVEGAPQQQVPAFFQRMRSHHRSALGYAMISVNGELLGSSLPEFEFDPESQPALDIQNPTAQLAIDTKTFQIGRPQLSSTIDDWVTPLYSPLFDQERNVSALMVAMLVIDTENTAWSQMRIEDNVEIVLVRNDGYLNYMYPEPATRERYDRIYRTQASDALRNLLRAESGWTSYDRPYTVQGGFRKHYLWIEPMSEYNMTAVAMKDRRFVIHAWLQTLTLPTLVWLLAVFALLFGYRRAKRLIDVADEDLQKLNTELSESLKQYNSLTQLLPVGVYQGVIHADGQREVIYLNERAREILRVPETVALRDVFSFIEAQVHPSDRYEYIHSSMKAARTQQPFRWKGRILHANEVRWVELQSVPQLKEEEGVVWNGVIIDATDSKRAEEQINQLAFYDALTQLPNRRLLHERIQQLMKQMQTKPQYAAILCFDIDNFKTLNDSLGHSAGDTLLKTLAERLQNSVREQDFVARIAGDEFIVVLSRLSEHASAAANQTRALASELIREFEKPVALGTELYRLTTSVGITLFDNDERPVELLLQQVDQAMYQAKAAGRNTHIFFDEKIQALLQSRLELVRDLHRAIENKEFALHYQLIIDANHQVHGVEGLVRWQHPERGMVSPSEFIPLAEETGDIIVLGERILNHACEQLVSWHQDPARAHWTMAVNLSVRQLRSPNFVERALQVIDASGVDPEYLILEITESMLLTETEDAIEKMKQLRARGVKFALDDFGTGYSSLSYLNQLPLDKLKIDQSFVQSLYNDEGPRTLTRTIISLGDSLGLELVAEGVETKGQMDLLAAQGCHYFQGYWINRPVPADQLSGIISRLSAEYFG
ncbi:MAG: diguanylate cyclase (GGDEF) domain [Idiomarinaceae bacterium HL-53]|nr:MAG: diguanylate cyclase (GGDEF) domain [Idiomarinaceae bacterium HL-53]CUS47709.1 diguanylate cyclase (GGDEF) domain-containing protein [Idiomarinaceae bacterium HL-53]